MHRLWPACLLALALLPPAPALAQGGPYRVDESAILAPGRAKLDAAFGLSFRRPREAEVTLPPAAPFRVLPMAEVSLGLSRSAEAADPGRAWATRLSPRVKIELLPLSEDRPFGLAVATGLTWRTAPGATRLETLEAVGILSVRPAEPLTLNLNLGVERDREARRTAPLWGLGAAWELREGTALIAAASGSDRGRAALQGGVRQALGERLPVLDLVLGRNLSDRRGSWLVLGLTAEF
ncbi:MAG: hypothetical protein N2Z67_11510 [Acetobacteraceae bacterium]|nr:hypothetical protein [Acetobacteraceae bacterium]